MSGIGAVQSGGMSSVWQQARYYMSISAARTAAADPARAETPVEPVDPVRALPSDTPVRFPVTFRDTQLPTVEDLNNASDNLSRMQIVFPGEEEADLTFPQQFRIGALENELAWKNGALSDVEDEDGEEALEAIGVNDSESPAEVMDNAKCETCEKRKYQDGSDDPGVSFKNPTGIKPEQAESAVRGHENEHVVRERAKAEMEGRKVVSQSVTIHTGICPECGRVYVSGGTTRTVTMGDDSDPSEQLREDRKKSENDLPFGEVA